MPICLQVSSLKACHCLCSCLFGSPLQLDRGNEKFVITHNKYIVHIFWLTLVILFLQLCLKSSKRSLPFSFDDDRTNLFQLIYSLPTTLIWFNIMKWPNTLTCTQINDYSQAREQMNTDCVPHDCLVAASLPTNCHLQSDFLAPAGCLSLCSVIRVGLGRTAAQVDWGSRQPTWTLATHPFFPWPECNNVST
jgi:hypothetical protein